MDISGRAAVVTGGASGIGQAVARRIFADGGNVIIFDLNAEAGAAMVEEMGADRCLFAEVNVADEASVEAGIDAAIEKFGAIYAVVNCAGIANASRTVGRCRRRAQTRWRARRRCPSRCDASGFRCVAASRTRLLLLRCVF